MCLANFPTVLGSIFPILGQNFQNTADCRERKETVKPYAVAKSTRIIEQQWQGWSYKFVKDNASSRKFHLTAFDGIVQQLEASVIDEPIDNISPEILKTALLELDDLNIVCETTKNTILELS